MGSISRIEVKKHETNIQNVSKTRKPCCSKNRSTSADNVLFLQRMAGNQAVGRLLRSGVLQAKLKIGWPGDKYEQEADRVADAVMRMPEPRAASSDMLSIQRACPKCEEEELKRQPVKEEDEEEKLQRKPAEEEEEEIQAKATSGGNLEVNPDIESYVHSLRGTGQSLSENERAFFEPRFGQDFSQVRVHTDAKATEAARAVNARAFTVGRDVVFGAGHYMPQTIEGKHLMSHELTHVVQQRSMPAIAGAEMIRSEIPSLPNKIHCQFITPLAPGGGFSGLMERDRQRISRERVLPFVYIKRNNIKFDLKTGTDYGHWWTEIDGVESYGWWPDHCPVTLKETLFGTRGDLNGVKGCGGKEKQDPHHGETADEMFKPILTVPKTDEQVRSEIRSFAMSYSGEWRWTFGRGQNCRTFQKSLMATVGLREPED